MDSLIPLARPSIGDAERSAAQRVLSGTQLTGGPERERFEKSLAQLSQRRHAIVTSSGTSALELALWSIPIEKGDRVLVTAFGFPAAANIIANRGATPVAVDVYPDTWLTNFQLAREAVDAKTKALVSIDQLGAVTRASDIFSFESDMGIPVISDAACGLGGSDQDDMPSGKSGRMATFSFHPRKLITTGEGGALVCDDDDLATTLRQLRNHGQMGGGKFKMPGTNARLCECSCAIGSAQLARLDPMMTERQMLVDGYKERLRDLKTKIDLDWQELPEGSVHANQCFALRLPKGCERAQVIAFLASQNIESGPATYSFSEIGIHPTRTLVPESEALHQRSLALPLYIGMRSGELTRVTEALESFFLGQKT